MHEQPRTHTDDTVLDLDPTAAFAASELPTGPTPPPRPAGSPERRRTRRLVAGAVVLALALGVAAAVVGGGGSSSTAAPAAGAEVGLASVDPTTTTLPPGDPSGDPSGGPQADVPEAQPEPPAAPGVLAVNPSAIWLFAGDYDGSFTVRNDGGSPIDWSFEGGIGAIGVSQWGGTLAPGASTVVTFAINPFQLADGPFVFVNHVVGGGFDKAITIHGVKTPIVVNPDLPKGPKTITP